MNDKERTATPERRKVLNDSMGSTIKSFEPILKERIITKEMLDGNANIRTDKIFDAFLTLNNYSLYMIIELASLLRACLRANSNTERRYNLKWINCVILEGYKHLYGYGRQRKKSIWKDRIEPLLKVVKHTNFEQDFKALEKHIIEFGESDITSRENRDLSFHYDLEAFKVYKMLMSLNEEEEIQKLIVFLNLLQDIFHFVSKYITEHWEHLQIDPKSRLKYVFPFSDFDIFQNCKEELYSSLDEKIRNQSKQLDEFILQQNYRSLINMHFQDLDSESSALIDSITEIGKVVIQMAFISIDMASASRAFISSEYSIEKQLALKQINTIFYEGVKKIYGQSDNSVDSFWTKYVRQIVLYYGDKAISDEANLIEQELQTLQTIVKTFDTQRRLSVHISEGIEKIYPMLHNLNPVKEFQKVKQILDILPKIIDFLLKCLYRIDLKRQTNLKKRRAPMNEKIDSILEILKNAPDSQHKDDLKRLLEKIKTGEFFDEIMSRRTIL